MTPICQKCHKPDPGKYYDIFHAELVSNTETRLSRRTTQNTTVYKNIAGESLFLCDSCVLKQMKKPYLVLFIVIVLFGLMFAAGIIGSILSGPENADAAWVMLFFLGCLMIGAYYTFRKLTSRVPSSFAGEILARSLCDEQLKRKPYVSIWLPGYKNNEGIPLSKHDTA